MKIFGTNTGKNTIFTLTLQIAAFGCISFNALAVAQTVPSSDTEMSLGDFPIYSVFYRVWDLDSCTTKFSGSVVDALIKNGRFNGFVCVSQNPDFIGKQDTIGINFYAKNLNECQQLVALYWIEAPSNRYSWYPTLQPSEQKRFLVGNNTCSVEYPL
jgi:hypothetical protein